MKSFEEVNEIVKSILSEKRYYHSICTMERCLEYADIYGEDKEKLKLVAIAHDIAKEIPVELRMKKAKEMEVELDEVEKNVSELIHAKIGAEIARKQFEFSEDMVNAIKYHTTGRENMSMLEKIVYLADASGKDRTYEDCKIIYELAKKNLDEALIFSLKSIIKKNLEKNRQIHPDSLSAYNFLIK